MGKQPLQVSGGLFKRATKGSSAPSLTLSGEIDTTNSATNTQQTNGTYALNASNTKQQQQDQDTKSISRSNNQLNNREGTKQTAIKLADADREIARILRKKKLGPFDFRHVRDTPDWLINPFQIYGYRVDVSLWQCFLSVFMLHNESFNIWTSGGMTLWLWYQAYVWWQEMDDVNKWILPVSCLMTSLASFFSTIFHTFLSHSPQTKKVLASFDYWGLFFLLTALSQPSIHYVFACDPFWRNFYLGLGVLNIVVGLPMSFWPWFRQNRSVRTTFFLFELMMVPIFLNHALQVHGWQSPLIQQHIYPVLFNVFVESLFAIFFFASRIPERFSPGTFDLHLQSHVIWHMIGNLGTVHMYSGYYRLYQFNSALPLCIDQ